MSFSWCAVFSVTVIILSQSLAYFPVFASVDTAIPILGHLLGLLYTSLLYGDTHTHTHCFCIQFCVCRVSSNVYSDYAAAQGCSFRGKMSHRDVCMYDTTHAVYTYTGMRYNTFYTHMCTHTRTDMDIPGLQSVDLHSVPVHAAPVLSLHSIWPSSHASPWRDPFKKGYRVCI